MRRVEEDAGWNGAQASDSAAVVVGGEDGGTELRIAVGAAVGLVAGRGSFAE